MNTRRALLPLAALGWWLSAACGDVHADLITGPGTTPTGCASDGDCVAPKPRCDMMSGLCVQCLNVGFVADCQQGTACAQPSGSCVTACTGPDACSSHVCNGTTGLCGVCSQDLDCPGTHPYCDTATHHCVECLKEQERGCADPDHPFCVNGVCVECALDGDCDGDERCSAELGKCAVPCQNSRCPSSEDPVCHPAAFVCVECAVDADCGGAPCRKWECVR